METVKNEKNYPDNNHHYGYSSDYGWEYLGSDDKYDYYVNHKHMYTSIVCSNEDHDYISAEYGTIMDGDESRMVSGTYKKYPYSLLRELIGIAAKKSQAKAYQESPYLN